MKVFLQHTLCPISSKTLNAGDAKSAKDAGIDFIYAEYGFGDVSKDCYVAKIESFAELAEIL